MCSKLAVFYLYYITVILLNDLEALSGALRGFQSIKSILYRRSGLLSLYFVTCLGIEQQ